MSKNKVKIYKLNLNSYDIRTVTHQGRKHIVVPVIMMVEGVHHGNHGPILHLAEELGKFPPSWDGIPVCIYHPEDAQGSISANCPEVIDSTVVGRVYHTVMDNGKLKSEAWLDEEKLGQVSPEALSAILSKQPLEVSLGMFSDEKAESGTWNGEDYNSVAMNHRPDHLALLPGAVGACSWQDGCGIRNNKEGGENLDKKILVLGKDKKEFNIDEVIKALSVNGMAVVQTNELGSIAILNAIREKIDSMDTETTVYYLEEVFDDFCIYKKANRGEGAPPSSTLYKRAYKVLDNGIVEFESDPIPVIRNIEYKEVINNNKGEEIMANDNKNKPCCKEKVEMLIQSDHSTFVEGDRDWLLEQEENVIDRFIAMQNNSEQIKKDLEKKIETNANKSQETVKTFEEKLKDPTQFMSLLPKEIKRQVEHGMALHEAHRMGIIAKILTQTEVYTEEELKVMETKDLEKLSSAIKVPDYSFKEVGNFQTNAKTVEPLLPVIE